MAMPHRRAGFTLLELLFAVLMIALLAVIAIPSYKTHILRSNRLLTQGILSDLATKQEVQSLQQGQYARDFSALVGSDNTNATSFFLNRNGQIAQSLHGNGPSIYKIELLNPSATSFTLRATAVGDQANDKNCDALTLTSSGLKSASARRGGDIKSCWQ